MASSTDKRAYLDYNASAPLRPEARAAMLAAMDSAGNPSSIHAEGRVARAIVEDARRAVAELTGAPARGIVFTSGGTEAGNLALTPLLRAPGLEGPLGRLILSAGEHVCMLAGHRFPAEAVEIAGLDGDGRIDLAALGAGLAGPPALLALQGANNETGVVQPVAAAAAMAHAHGGLVVCDAVQLAGRAPLDDESSGADFLILSAHKLGGPKGVGALIASRPEVAVASPMSRGGGQERGGRAGTENLIGIAGFGAAARAAKADMAGEAARLTELRGKLEGVILEAAPDAVVFGVGAPRLPNTVNFAAPGVAAATLLPRLDLEGIAASSGSACSSGKVARSHVLTAMGVAPDLAAGAIRLSLGWASTAADVELFAAAFARTIAALRRRSGRGEHRGGGRDW
jgi:cysteine desulfurase